MTLIYIMRHAQSVINVERRITGRTLTGDLTDLGREQSAKAGSWLANKGITRIIHSPFHRTAQTAAIVNNSLGVPIASDSDLGEVDSGDLDWKLDDVSWQEWWQIFERWKQRDWKATYPGGESFQTGFDRFNRCLMNLPHNEIPLLVTHGAISLAVIPYLCVNAAALQGSKMLDHTGIVKLEPYGDGRFICRAWNQIDYM